MQDTGCLELVHWDNPERWYGVGGGFRIGNMCTPVADSCWCMAKPIQYCKVNTHTHKLNIQKTKILASGPITSWQIDGETMETVRDYFGGSKITADGDCSHEIKRHLLLGRKAMTNLDSILKSRDITLPTKVCIVKVMFFQNSLAFSMIQWILAIWSLVPLPFLNPAWASKSSWFMYCWRIT